MAKFLIDGQALDDLAGKIQRLEVLFDVIQEEVTGSKDVRVCVLCDIGHDIGRLAGADIKNLWQSSRVDETRSISSEVGHG
ncbi:hypothetical protein B7759_02293 [Burkholderia glumae]|uniref:hypothetical protein n=1 Tax=Burkholderia glumae TaxID=337 RepID=UPI001AEAE5E5|nr:hypothetical protein [Burkholderia glumae]QTP33690.1 hypothetical protein B7759_02293 [Burkholderia glumae]